MKSRLTTLFVLLNCVFLTLNAADIVESQVKNGMDIASSAEFTFVSDIEGLKLKDLKSLNYKSNKSNVISEGFKEESIIVRFPIHNNTDLKEFIIEFNGIDHVNDGFVITENEIGQVTTKRVGHITRHENEFLTTDFSFQYTLDPNESNVVYVILDLHNDDYNMSIKVWEPSYFMYKENTLSFYNAIFYGVLLIVLFFNLYTYIKTRFKISLYYTLYVFSIGLGVIMMENSGERFLGYFFGTIAFRGAAIVVLLSLVFNWLFYRKYLQIPSKYNVVHSIINGLIITILFFCVLFMFVDQKLINVSFFSSMIVLVSIICTVVITLYFIKEGNKKATMFISAFLMLFSGAIIKFLHLNGIVDFGVFENFAMKFGIVGEVTVLSIYMVNDFQKKQLLLKDIAYKRILEINRLNKESKSKLESLVVERTKKVEDQKKLIELKNNNISNQNLRLQHAIKIANQNSEVKDNFLSNMSHEIRTPLNGIIGTLEVLKETELNERQQRFVDLLSTTSDNLHKIISDILDLAKISANKLQLKPSNYCLKKEITSVFLLFESKAKEKNNKITLEFDGNIPEQIYVDGGKVIQILQNYLSNAIKFSSDSEVKVIVSLYRTNQVKINVIDEGIGIEQNNLDKLFKKFNQIDDGNKKSFEGTGLGLAISKDLSVLLGGEVGVSSTVGEGSEFWFSFKFDEAKIEVKKRKKTNSYQLPSLHVLLAEDVKTNQILFEYQLEQLNCTVDLVENGKELVSAYQKGKYDIILTDIRMPEMDGIEAVTIIRDTYEGLPPIIALSANPKSNCTPEELMKFDAYLEKPFHLNELKTVMYQLVMGFAEEALSNEEEKPDSVSGGVIHEQFNMMVKDVGDRAKVKELYSSFLVDGKKTLDLINQNIITGEFEKLQLNAHSLKGIAAFFKLTSIQKCSEAVEKKIKASNYNVEEDLYKLNEVFKESIEEIQDLLKSTTSQTK